MNRLEKKKNLLKKELLQDLEGMKSSMESLDYSYNKCLNIGIKEDKDEYSPDELESFEALTSRFARTADILTQKILTTVMTLLKENPKSFIDKVNLAEKLEIIPSSVDMQEIRELRNEIAHEYSLRDITEIFGDVLSYAGELKKAVAGTQAFVKNRVLA